MKNIIKWLMVRILFWGMVLFPIAGFCADPGVSDLIVTDVTPTSFSVVWTASEPSTADLDVFRDVNGFQTADEAVIVPHPLDSGDAAIREAAETNGVMKVRVTGLQPDTIYFFRTVTASKDSAEPGVNTYPDSGPYPHVITQGKINRILDLAGSFMPFANDILVRECFQDDGVTPADGTLLLAYVHGCQYPLSSFAGDGIGLPYARIDLNNAFSESQFENISLSGKESVFLVQYMGLNGQIREMTGLPCNDMQIQNREPEFKDLCQGDFTGDGRIGAQEIHSFSKEFALQYDPGSNPSPVWGDLNRDGQVDGRDIGAMADLAANGDCPVCR